MTKPSYIMDNLNVIFPDSSAENKLFCLMLANEIGENKTIALSVIEMSAKFGVSKNTVTKSFKYLLSKNVVEQHKIPSINKGFLNSYSFDGGYRFITKGFVSFKNKSSGFHQDRVAMLISPKSNINKHSKLKLANRLLFATLLMHANEQGICSSLGVADLQALTGMSKDRLKSQLTKLKTLGFIRASISGVTGKYILGHASTLYWLNLKHAFFGEIKDYGMSLILNKEETFYLSNAESREALELMKVVQALRVFEPRLNTDKTVVCFEDLVNSPGAPLTIEYPIDFSRRINSLIDKRYRLLHYLEHLLVLTYHVFEHPNPKTLGVYLQAKLDEYSSRIITSHLNSTPSKNTMQYIDSDKEIILKKDIANDFTNRPLPNNPRVSTLTADQVNSLLIQLIYWMVIKIARTVINKIQRIDEIGLASLERTRIDIRDYNVNAKYLSIDITYLGANKNEIIYPIGIKNAKTVFSKKPLDSLSEAENQKYGMISKIDKKPDNWPKKTNKT